MKIYQIPYNIEKNEYEKAISLSHHYYLYKNINNLLNIENIIYENQATLNTKDLHGKFCSLNFLLDIFLFHHNNKFNYYPKDQNFQLDFLIIIYLLTKNNAAGNIEDYKGNNFFNNLSKINFTIPWQSKYNFLHDHLNAFILMNNLDKKILLLNLLKEDNNRIYSTFFLNFTLDESTKFSNIKKI